VAHLVGGGGKKDLEGTFELLLLLQSHKFWPSAHGADEFHASLKVDDFRSSNVEKETSPWGDVCSGGDLKLPNLEDFLAQSGIKQFFGGHKARCENTDFIAHSHGYTQEAFSNATTASPPLGDFFCCVAQDESGTFVLHHGTFPTDIMKIIFLSSRKTNTRLLLPPQCLAAVSCRRRRSSPSSVLSDRQMLARWIDRTHTAVRPSVRSSIGGGISMLNKQDLSLHLKVAAAAAAEKTAGGT